MTSANAKEPSVTAFGPADPESSESSDRDPDRIPAARRVPARLLLIVVAVVSIGVAAGVAFARCHERIGRGVVVIDTNLGYENSAAAGTGMVLSSSGEVLTNNHVIKGATTIRIVVPGTWHSYAAKVVGYDVRQRLLSPALLAELGPDGAPVQAQAS